MNKYMMQLRLKEAAKLLNNVVGNILGINNLAIQMKQELQEEARKVGEMVTELYNMSIDKEDVFKDKKKPAVALTKK